MIRWFPFRVKGQSICLTSEEESECFWIFHTSGRNKMCCAFILSGIKRYRNVYIHLDLTDTWKKRSFRWICFYEVRKTHSTTLSWQRLSWTNCILLTCCENRSWTQSGRIPEQQQAKPRKHNLHNPWEQEQKLSSLCYQHQTTDWQNRGRSGSQRFLNGRTGSQREPQQRPLKVFGNVIFL